MLPYPLTKFEIQKGYQNELRYNGVYSKNCLAKTKNGSYAINLNAINEYRSIGTQLLGFYVNGDNLTYFDSREIEHIAKEMKKIYRQQRY